MFENIMAFIFLQKNKKKHQLEAGVIYRHFCIIIKLVPGARLELARACTRWILSPLRLPIPPSRHEGYSYREKFILSRKTFAENCSHYSRFLGRIRDKIITLPSIQDNKKKFHSSRKTLFAFFICFCASFFPKFHFTHFFSSFAL